MKKHVVLGLCLLASTAVHAKSHITHGAIEKAIEASERAIKRGSANVHLVAAITALKGALDNIQETQANLTALKARLIKISAAVDAGIVDLDNQIRALGVIAGQEEAAVEAAPVAPAPVVAPVVAPVAVPVAPAAPAVVDADEQDHTA